MYAWKGNFEGENFFRSLTSLAIKENEIEIEKNEKFKGHAWTWGAISMKILSGTSFFLLRLSAPKSRDFCDCDCKFPPQSGNRCDF